MSDLDDQQNALAEVSHDLANRFHRSYYFLDLLEDAIESDPREAVALVERLRDSVNEIEAMSRGALDFVRPLELRRLAVSVDDLVASLRQHAGMRAVEVRDDTGAGKTRVAVDPVRISQTLAEMGRQATAGDDDSGAPLRVDLAGGPFVSLSVHCVQEAGQPLHPSLPLRVCARIARLHGGSLEIDDGGKRLVLSLPAVQGET